LQKLFEETVKGNWGQSGLSSLIFKGVRDYFQPASLKEKLLPEFTTDDDILFA